MRARRPPSHALSIETESPFAVCLDAGRDGKAWALAALYRRLHAKLLRYLFARDPGLAEVVAARVWRHVSAGLPDFAGDEAAFTSWVFVLARRQLIAVRAETPELDSARSAVALDEATRRALERVAQLPDAEADVFLLRTVAGLSVEDVALIVTKPRHVVRALQLRAIEQLAGAHRQTPELVA